MILYNVTVSVDLEIEDDWVKWMKEIHIPEMMKTGCFNENKFLKLLNERPDVEGSTFAVQFFAKSSALIDEYLDKHATDLRQRHIDRFGNKTAAFRTLLEEI